MATRIISPVHIVSGKIRAHMACKYTKKRRKKLKGGEGMLTRKHTLLKQQQLHTSSTFTILLHFLLLLLLRRRSTNRHLNALHLKLGGEGARLRQLEAGVADEVVHFSVIMMAE